MLRGYTLVQILTGVPEPLQACLEVIFEDSDGGTS